MKKANKLTEEERIQANLNSSIRKIETNSRLKTLTINKIINDDLNQLQNKLLKQVTYNTMKNEKLELLLNKVVAFDQPNVAYYKGFLYKDNRGYYIKVVESTLGSFFLNDKIFLKDGDEQFITQADKPKLMRVSLKSWHYRLIKYVLGSKAPTPKTMQNGCPYFWLLIFSVLVSPFVLLGSGLWFVIGFIPRLLFLGLENWANTWVIGISDEQAFDLYDQGRSSKFGIPVTAKLFMKRNDEDVIDLYIKQKYNIDYRTDSKAWCVKRDELREKWATWYQEERKKMDAAAALRSTILMEERRKRMAREAKWEARTAPIKKNINNIIDTLYSIFDFDWKSIIKRTKQVVGAVLTFLLLAFSFVVVCALTLGLSMFFDWSGENYMIYVYLLSGLVGAGICWLLSVFVGGWLQTVVNKYRSGTKVWYVEPFIYLFYYPLKYVAIFLGYAVLVPIKFVFYNVLWKFILVNLGLFFWKVIRSIGRGLASSTGVFGEYFSASYTDYCPGIEWADTELEEREEL